MAGGLLARAESALRHSHAARRRSSLAGPSGSSFPLPPSPPSSADSSPSPRPAPTPGTDIATLIAANPEFYNLSLGHLFDLTGAAMGLFRGPLGGQSPSACSPSASAAYLLRRRGLHLRRQPHPRRRDDRHPAGRARGSRPLLPHPRLQRPRPRRQRHQPQALRQDHPRWRTDVRLLPLFYTPTNSTSSTAT